MANALVALGVAPSTAAPGKMTYQEFVTLRLGGQLFGISVMAVQDVMRKQPIAPIPLASPMIAGALNVRGRIVTAINMRHVLGMRDYSSSAEIMKVVVEYQNELYALMIDAVGDVLSLPSKQFEKVPTNMDAAWRSLAAGVFKLEKELLIVLDVGQVIAQIKQ